MKTNNLFLVLLLCISFFDIYAQTCCSGGVPTSGNLGLPTSAAKTLQWSINYDLNVLNTQQTGRSTETTPENFRKTHSFMFQLGYSFSERMSVDAFLPYIRQERRSNSSGDLLEFTSGIGDAVLLFKYYIPFNKDKTSGLSIGLGPKFPIGSINIRNKLGSILLADLQPGSGSWDALLWAQFTKNLNFRPTMNFMIQGTYKINGKNNDFGIEPLTVSYQFGTEWQFITSLSDRLLLGSYILDSSISLKYRKANSDKRKPNNISQELTEVPSTGGEWIFINPGITYWPNTKWSFNINFELPLFADIDGTQVTPTYRINTGFFYRISLGKENNINPIININP